MSIKDFTQKIKLFFLNIKDKIYSQEKGLKIKDDLYIILIIILVGTASFGLGKISNYEKNKTPISILKTKEYIYSSLEKNASDINGAEIKNIQNTDDKKINEIIVASKSGTKYYYLWCSGVSKIKEKNKIYFKTIEEAKSAGLTPATNCIGLK